MEDGNSVKMHAPQLDPTRPHAQAIGFQDDARASNFRSDGATWRSSDGSAQMQSQPSDHLPSDGHQHF